MSFQFSLFDNLTEEKPLFFFTTLHYPKELMTYCKKSELPKNIGAYIVVKEEESAVKVLVNHGIKNPMTYVNYVMQNQGKWICFLEYKELPIF